MTVTTEVEQMAEELRRADKLLLTTHENPDGDALGSLLATHEILGLMGKDSLMLMSADEFPLPYEYRHMDFSAVLNAAPEDIEQRTVVFLDCGNIDRMPIDSLHHDGARILNIDHHHDNTRFGTVNLVNAQASCTAEIVWNLARELGVELTPRIADALYVALVTDTGRFMYENTGESAHRMAAELIEQGVEPDVVYRRLYEGVPFGKVLLLARALARVERHDGGAFTISHLTTEDFEETESLDNYSEGIVDHLRSIEGSLVGCLVRDLDGERAGQRKVSLRASDGRVDVSLIARGFGGGGHRQAAGFTTELPMPELIARLRVEVGRQLPSG